MIDNTSNDNWFTNQPVPENYEAYLYRVVIDSGKPRNKYVGYHKGEFDGTYKGSPVTHKQEYFEDLGKYHYTVEALMFDYAENIIREEKMLLDKIKSDGKLDEYYNESLGGGRKLKRPDEKILSIKTDIEEGKFKEEDVNKEFVYKMETYQVRDFTLNTSHVQTLKNLIENSDGKDISKYHNGVWVLEDFDGKGKHRRIGSAHITTAVQNIPQVKTLKVIYIPESRWKDLNKAEIRALGKLDNPIIQNPTLETTVNEQVGMIVELCHESDITPNNQACKNLLRELGVSNTNMYHRINKAKKELKNIRSDNKTEIQCDYENESSEESKRLKQKMDAFESKGDGKAIKASAVEYMRNAKAQLLRAIVHREKEHTFFKVFVYFNNGTAKELHKNLVKEHIPEFERTIEYLDRNDKNITITYELMEYMKPNPLFAEKAA